MRLPDPRFQNGAHFWKTEGQLYKIYVKPESSKLREISREKIVTLFPKNFFSKLMSHGAFDGVKLRKCNFIPRNFIPTPLHVISLI